jgi:hypothetical protein
MEFTNLDFEESSAAPAETFNVMENENVVDSKLADTHPKALARRKAKADNKAKAEAAKEIAADTAVAGVDEEAEKDATGNPTGEMDAIPSDLPVVEFVVSFLHRRAHHEPHTRTRVPPPAHTPHTLTLVFS